METLQSARRRLTDQAAAVLFRLFTPQRPQDVEPEVCDEIYYESLEHQPLPPTFLSLPVELRVLVYEQLFASLTLPIAQVKRCLRSTAILRLNHSIRREAQPLLYSLAVFRIRACDMRSYSCHHGARSLCLSTANPRRCAGVRFDTARFIRTLRIEAEVMDRFFQALMNERPRYAYVAVYQLFQDLRRLDVDLLAKDSTAFSSTAGKKEVVLEPEIKRRVRAMSDHLEQDAEFWRILGLKNRFEVVLSIRFRRRGVKHCVAEVSDRLNAVEVRHVVNSDAAVWKKHLLLRLEQVRVEIA